MSLGNARARWGQVARQEAVERGAEPMAGPGQNQEFMQEYEDEREAVRQKRLPNKFDPENPEAQC